MCGICGFFGKKKNKREIVEKMKEKLVHRGPDAQGSFVNDSVALGFRRLSIIDLEGGLQPMKSSSQNLTVVFNGEIYNYQELREQMEREKKILFVTRSDTETLVNGLEAYGPAFVEQLRGRRTDAGEGFFRNQAVVLHSGGWKFRVCVGD